eukprot:GHVR01020898.1.p1 GENE.GHVR01020898.1~~GHVR01020898.1.p1  ORF type:complete len:515 (-),score=39.66 GHVR01020898.1:151-1695(-)
MTNPDVGNLPNVLTRAAQGSGETNIERLADEARLQEGSRTSSVHLQQTDGIPRRTRTTSGEEDISGYNDTQTQEYLERISRERKAQEAEKDHEEQRKHLKQKNNLCDEITQRIELSIHKNLGPTFTDLHNNQKMLSFQMLSESFQKLINRCDTQFSDITNRHQQLSRAIQDTTPVAGPFSLHQYGTLPKPHFPNSNSNPTNSFPVATMNGVKLDATTLKTLLGNIQDITDIPMQQDTIWVEAARLDSRIIPLYDSHANTLEKSIDDALGWRDIAVRAIRQLKNIAAKGIASTHSTAPIEVPTSTSTNNDPLMKGLSAIVETMNACNEKVIKSISDDKNKTSKYFDKVKKPEDMLTHIKLHGNLTFIINGLFPELEDFTRDACDEERRKSISDKDWKSLRDGLKTITKITDRIPILDDRGVLALQNAITGISGTANMGTVLSAVGVWPKHQQKNWWKNNNNNQNNWNTNDNNDDNSKEDIREREIGITIISNNSNNQSVNINKKEADWFHKTLYR